MAGTCEKCGTDDHELRSEWSHRVEEFLNTFDGIEFALRAMREGDEKESHRNTIRRILGLMNTNLENA